MLMGLRGVGRHTALRLLSGCCAPLIFSQPDCQVQEHATTKIVAGLQARGQEMIGAGWREGAGQEVAQPTTTLSHDVPFNFRHRNTPRQCGAPQFVAGLGAGWQAGAGLGRQEGGCVPTPTTVDGCPGSGAPQLCPNGEWRSGPPMVTRFRSH